MYICRFVIPLLWAYSFVFPCIQFILYVCPNVRMYLRYLRLSDDMINMRYYRYSFWPNLKISAYFLVSDLIISYLNLSNGTIPVSFSNLLQPEFLCLCGSSHRAVQLFLASNDINSFGIVWNTTFKKKKEFAIVYGIAC